ncbi:hypothetical protein [Streptomyces venezuelae]|uniref:hypothetical protein n=1 Tax=Streptomyces venezuelae TaxID=54571 RepID=UPI00168CEDB2|nr:hypothetical protein [Streptomyces venezuelae]
MPRKEPSRLELALAAEVAKYGHTVTPTQLERWRQRLWLARTTHWLDPDGAIRPEVVNRAIQLAMLSTQGRGIGWGGWVFWAIDDTPASAKQLRNALVAALKLPLERAGVEAGQIPDGDSDEAFEAREQIAAQLLKNRHSPRQDFDGTLRAGAAEAGFELPPSRSVPNLFHRALTEPGARMLVGGVGDVGFEGLMESWAATWPEGRETFERVRAAHREAALAGVDLMAQSPMETGLIGLMRAVEQADAAPLCAAVRACTKASGTLGMLLSRAVRNPEVIRQLMNRVMWDQWVRVGVIAPDGTAGEAAIALSTVQYLLIPGWSDDLHRYQAFMDHLLHDPPRARPSSHEGGREASADKRPRTAST